MATATPDPFASGDVECDGDLDVVDALAVLRFTAALGPFAECLNVADVNCDGLVGAVDALLIQRHVAGLPVALPPGCPPIRSVLA